jgi:hypothetical protein
MDIELAIETSRDGYRTSHRNFFGWIQNQQQKSIEMDTQPSAFVALMSFIYWNIQCAILLELFYLFENFILYFFKEIKTLRT